MEERNVTVGGRNRASRIVHHIAATVERHLGVVLWIERRVVMIARVVEVFIRPDAVLRVESLLLSVSGCLATSLSRGDGSRDSKCEDQTEEHQTGNTVEQDLDVDQYFGETSVSVGGLGVGLVHAVVVYAAALGNNAILFSRLAVGASLQSLNICPVAVTFDPTALECWLQPVPEPVGQDVLCLVIGFNVPVEAVAHDVVHGPRPGLSVEEDESSYGGSEQDEKNHDEAPQHADRLEGGATAA